MDRIQELAVRSNAERLQIIGPPGTGKTKVLANRIARLVFEGVAPESVVALTFTNSSCLSLRKSIAQVLNNSELSDRIRINTFHSFCQDLIRENPEVVGLETQWEMTDFLDMKNVLYYPFIGHNRRRKQNLVSPEVLDQTRKVLQRLKAYDFGQALEYGQRVAQKVDSRIAHLVVDEFQDCSVGQWRLVKALLASAPASHLVVAGDPNQEIFNFQENHLNDAMTAMTTAFPETETLHLTYNYRSTKQIIDLFEHILPPKEPLIATLPDGVEPSLSFQQDTFDELKELTHIVRSLCCVENAPYTFDDIAVLVRLNSQANQVRHFFNQQGIPTKQEQSIRALATHKMVSVALTFMKWSLTPRDFYLAQLLYNRFYKHMTDAAFQKLLQKMSTSTESLTSLLVQIHPKYNRTFLTEFLPKMQQQVYHSTSPKEVIAHVQYTLLNWHKAAGVPPPDISLDRRNWDAFISLLESGCRELSSENFVGDGDALSALLRFCSLRDNPTALAQREGKVSVSTIHSAKSNEWPVVLLPSLQSQTTPSSPSYAADRRLLYVATSRARERLYLTNAGPILSNSRNLSLPVPVQSTMSLSDAKAKYPLVFKQIPLTRKILRLVSLKR